MQFSSSSQSHLHWWTTSRYNSCSDFHNINKGVYGFPKCPGANETICEYVRELLDLGAYNEFVQAFLVQAEYWHVSNLKVTH